MVTYSFWITFSIAVSTIVAAVYYLILIIDYYSNLVGKKLPLYYGLAVTVFLLILGMLFGVSLTIGLILLKKSLKKKKEIVPYE